MKIYDELSKDEKSYYNSLKEEIYTAEDIISLTLYTIKLLKDKEFQKEVNVNCNTVFYHSNIVMYIIRDTKLLIRSKKDTFIAAIFILILKMIEEKEGLDKALEQLNNQFSTIIHPTANAEIVYHPLLKALDKVMEDEVVKSMMKHEGEKDIILGLLWYHSIQNPNVIRKIIFGEDISFLKDIVRIRCE